MATMHQALRHRCVVVLVGEGYTSGDGNLAFSLAVDLVVRKGDLARLGELVKGAVQGKRSLVAPLDAAAAARLGG